MEKTDNYNNSNNGLTFSFADSHGEETRLFSELLNEKDCRDLVLRDLHQGVARCPACEIEVTDTTTLANFWRANRCICKNCKSSFTATTGTFLQGSHLTFAQIVVLRFLYELKNNSINASLIAELLGFSPDTARKWMSTFEDMND
ncbi:MAG: hypothetical protein KAT46_05355 [Deltaproteobacteria bacterium]|nr:hypothetical protein [Deltaproteobacteria bacterium]